MYRYSRTITLKNSHSYQPALQAGQEITTYLNRSYDIQVRFGVELFGGARLHWYNDMETLDAMTKLNARLLQDQSYHSLLGKMAPWVVEGSVEDRIVQMAP